MCFKNLWQPALFPLIIPVETASYNAILLYCNSIVHENKDSVKGSRLLLLELYKMNIPIFTYKFRTWSRIVDSCMEV